MKIIISSLNTKITKAISCENLDTIDQTFKKFNLMKGPLEAKIFAINESISSDQLSKLKNIFDNLDYSSIFIYSNDRNSIVTGKSLKINSTFVNEKEAKKELLSLTSKKKEDILHEGTVRSGSIISSNGNLCIIGDVNPGATVSAKKNIYVWGKLLGIAFAGNSGNNNSSISSLYLNPLQLRISNVVAIGPKDKPKNFYPEIALIENQTIVIKPYIIEPKN